MNLLPLLGYLFIRTLHATLRVRHVRVHYAEEHPQRIIAYWHECIVMALHSRWRKPVTSISSRSRDGEIVNSVLQLYGVMTARGSSTRGGGMALRGALRNVREGSSIAITPDGPKGPRRVVKNGIVFVAQVSELPVVPFHFTARSKKRLRSWDSQIVPMPFSRALYLYGEPIVVPREGDVEEWRQKIERDMNALAEEAERDFDALWASAPRRVAKD